MRLALIIPALILPLAACNQSPTVSATNATQTEVQEKVAAANGGEGMTIRPGRWEGKMTMHDLDMPNLPAAAKAQMKASMASETAFISCVTPDDVKKQKAFFTGDKDDKACKYDHFNLAGGKIDAAMSCNRETGKMAMKMAGTYSPDSYDMTMDSKAEGKGPMAAMTIKMSIAAKRVGECRGTQDES